MPQRYKIKLDDQNRLILTDSFSEKQKGFHLKGDFLVERGRDLVFHVAPDSRKLVPYQKINISGSWELNPDHDLTFTLDQSNNQVFGETLTLKGEIVKADKSSLSFSLGSRRTPKGVEKNILELAGDWQADKYNRISFHVKRTRSKEENVLVFTNTWHIGENNTLVYIYSRQSSKKTTQYHRIVFNGSWDIARGVLKYRLERSIKEDFLFKVSYNRPILEAKNGKFVFSVGVGAYTDDGRVQHELSLSGQWIVSRDLTVSFDMDMEGGRKKRIKFKARYKLGGGNTVVFTLIDEANKPIGFELSFTRRFFNDKSWFLKLQHSADESAIYGGVSLQF